jgi:integrase
MSERGAPMLAVAFRRMVTRLGPAAKMPFGIHPHMLRHSTGFKLANQGVDTRSLQHYLGHKNIHTPSDTASFPRIGFEISGKTERQARGRVPRPNLA